MNLETKADGISWAKLTSSVAAATSTSITLGRAYLRHTASASYDRSIVRFLRQFGSQLLSLLLIKKLRSYRT